MVRKRDPPESSDHPEVVVRLRVLGRSPSHGNAQEWEVPATVVGSAENAFDNTSYRVFDTTLHETQVRWLAHELEGEQASERAEGAASNDASGDDATSNKSSSTNDEWETYSTDKMEVAVNRRAPLEGPGSLFFPQRLKMACLLSLWISTVLSLIIANLARWLYNILMTTGLLDAALASHASVSDQMIAATRLSDAPIALLTSLSVFGIHAKPQAVDDGGEASNVYTRVALAVPYTGVGVLVTTFLAQWWCIFAAFRSDSYELRRGAYFFDKASFPEELANRVRSCHSNFLRVPALANFPFLTC